MTHARLRVAVVIALGIGIGACTGGQDAGPGPTTDPGASTTLVDRSGIVLAGVAGETTTTIVETGHATISGTVRGPSGPVGGATVRLERLVAGHEIRTDALTAPDGSFAVTGVPGGRYRVRAFLAPRLAQVVPDVRFLEDGKEHVFDLVVEAQSGLLVRADVAPDPPLLGQAVNLVAVVTDRTVDADGIVRAEPVRGISVELVGLGRWVLRDDAADSSTTTTSSTSTSVPFESTTSTTAPERSGPSPVDRTDASGQVRYRLRCERVGAPGLALRVPVTLAPVAGSSEPRSGTQTIVLELPPCVERASTTTTGAPATTPP